jgi:hypothetical protein
MSGKTISYLMIIETYKKLKPRNPDDTQKQADFFDKYNKPKFDGSNESKIIKNLF